MLLDTQLNPVAILHLSIIICVTITFIYFLIKKFETKFLFYFCIFNLTIILKHLLDYMYFLNFNIMYKKYSLYILAMIPFATNGILQKIFNQHRRISSFVFLILGIILISLESSADTIDLLLKESFFMTSMANLILIYYFISLFFMSIIHIKYKYILTIGDEKYFYSIIILFLLIFSALDIKYSIIYNITDISILFIIYYLVSNHKHRTIYDIIRRMSIWFILTSLPLVFILVFFTALIKYANLHPYLIYLLLLIIYYLLFLYFRVIQAKIDKYFKLQYFSYKELLSEYKSILIKIKTEEDLIKAIQYLIYNLFPNDKTEVYYPKGNFLIPVKINKEKPHNKILIKDYTNLLYYIFRRNLGFQISILDKLQQTDIIYQEATSFNKKFPFHIIFPLNLDIKFSIILTVFFNHNQKDLNYNQLYLLKEIQNITTIAFSNILLYEELKLINLKLNDKIHRQSSNLKETQAQLTQSEKMASIGVMVAGITHEINTPIGVIGAGFLNIKNQLNESVQGLQDVNNFDSDLFKIICEEVSHTKESFFKQNLYFEKKKYLKKIIKEYSLEEATATQVVETIFIFQLHDYIDFFIKLITKNPLMFNLSRTILYFIKNMKNIDIAINQITKIIQALKYYSRVEQSIYEYASIKESIETTLIILTNQIKYNIKLKLFLDELPPIRCTLSEINQLWTNLLQNSIHSIKKKGEILISLKSVYFSKLPKKEYIFLDDDFNTYLTDQKTQYEFQQVIIQDTGTGIPKAILYKIFDPFFTTKPVGKGTGIGLGLVKNIVIKHEGYLIYTSVPQNTVFTIYLPARYEKKN